MQHSRVSYSDTVGVHSGGSWSRKSKRNTGLRHGAQNMGCVVVMFIAGFRIGNTHPHKKGYHATDS